MSDGIRRTRSVCPRCLKNLPASLRKQADGRVLLEKTCPEHGSFRVTVWQGTLDFDQWLSGTEPLAEGAALSCPAGCGLCPEHDGGSCCVLLEVTGRCNLHCRYCFAEGGDNCPPDPSAETLKEAIRQIADSCDHPLLQFSGGEPTLRDDLPELVRFAREAGCSYTQLNTNGIRLAEDPDYARTLAEAGLDIVFLQFDGTREEIYETLRGKALLDVKKRAIQVCGELCLGVTLVPTVVAGVNDDNLGELVRFAVSQVPSVRGIHFQPVSYFGRYPGNGEGERYTLDRLMTDLSEEAGIPVSSFMPSRCDHPLCGFHSSYLIEKDGSLRPLSSITHSAKTRGCARDNREYVGRHWKRPPEEEAPQGLFSGEMDFDTFLYRVNHQSLTLSAMAFQDAMNLNLERLHRCTLHVYDKGKIKPFCARYLSPMTEN